MPAEPMPADPVDPTQGKDMPTCTRCSHSFDEHERPGVPGKSWPCTKIGCDCAGYVVARDLREDVKYMATKRLEVAVSELYPEHFGADEIQQKVSDVIQRVDDA